MSSDFIVVDVSVHSSYHFAVVCLSVNNVKTYMMVSSQGNITNQRDGGRGI